VTSIRKTVRLAAAAALAALFGCAGSGGSAPGPTPSLTLTPSATSILNDGTKVRILASAVTATGTPGSGTVSFLAGYGALTDPTTGAAVSSAALDAAGTARVDYACNIAVDTRCTAGAVFVSGSWTSAGKTLQLNVTAPSGGTTTPPPSGGGGTPPPPTGTPPGAPTVITVSAAQPFVLGLKGSGIQERGTMTFLVTDALGVPVPNTGVTFAVQAPQLGITLMKTSTNTDANGVAQASYQSGTQVGVTSITATVTSTGASVSRAVAVRGAKPSANGFYFRCEHASLPVYTTIGQYETMTCTVRLTDRYGNRVGIPTVVSFATEAGAITASATTQAFDIAAPDDPKEGTLSVTFTTDTGNGNTPADVAPLGPTATQFPWPRGQEPSYTFGSLTVNPRDQLVTIVAMTRGEEAFEDANGDGIYTAGEAFVDQGDPYVDADDNGAYDAAPASGLPEIRFCGLNADCSTYHGPNGTWDADTVIWKPTWVVFTGAADASTIPNNGFPPPSPPPPDFNLSCADYSDVASDPNHETSITAVVYEYDHWLNMPAAGTTTTVGAPSAAALKLDKFGFGPWYESWGSMGVLGFDFDWVRVSAADNTQPCSAATSPCVEKLVFRRFLDGFAGTIMVTNTLKTPTASDPLGASSTGFGCAPTPDQYGTAGFLVPIDVLNAHAVDVGSTVSGTYARGTGG
jgi:hypothetical protein